MTPASSGQLTGILTRVHRHLERRAAVAAALWLGVGVAMVLGIAWLAAGGQGWRQGSNLPAALDLLMLLWVLAGVAWFRTRATSWFGEVPLARSVERAAGMRPGVVRGALELTRGLPGGISGSLAERAVSGTASGLGGRPAEELAGELGGRVAIWTRRGVTAAALSVVLLAVLGVVGPERAARAWAGVSSPLSTMADPELAPIVVSPGTVEVMRGTDVRVDVDAQGRFSVDVAWQAAGDVARSRRLDLVGGRASHVFEAVSATTEYRIETDDGTRTETFVIVPIDPLFISELVLGVEYPPHTGIEPDEYRGSPPPLRLPVGSRLTVQGLSSRPLSAAGLADSVGERRVELEVDGASFRGGWTPVRSGTYAWAFSDRTGLPAEIQPEPLEIRLVPDSVPSVAFLVPGQDTILPLSLRQPLVIDARDDYGLERFELVAYRVTSFGESHEPIVQGTSLGGTRAVLARPALDVSDWGLMPGDAVRYYARVVDNNPAAQTAVTPEYELRMPDVEELRREAEATLESVAERLEELRAEAERQAEENANRAMEAAARPEPEDMPPDAAFEEREELRRALEEQTALMSEVDSLTSRIEALQETMEETGQSDPALESELDELQEMLRELTGDELEERVEELSESLEEGNEARGEEALDQLAQEQDELRGRLERATEAFERAAIEQDFRATTEEAQELARQERAVAQAMRENDDAALRAQQQEDLARNAENLEARMDSLAERLASVGEEEASARVEEARQEAAEARERMEQAAEQAQQGDNESASEQAAQAAEQMQEAASGMEEAQEGMAEESAEEAQAAFQQAADEALSLARRQDDLRRQMQRSRDEAQDELRSDQASLLRGLESVAQRLQEGAESGGGDPAMSAQIGRTMESMQAAAEAMEGERPGQSQSQASAAAARAEQAVAGLNQIALMAMAGAQQAGESGAGQSGEDAAAQVGQLAQRQGELLSETGDIQRMRLGEQATRQQLTEMSGRQQRVARDIQGVTQEPGAGSTLGDLEEMAREADLLAQLLGRGRLTPEILQRQERLFHRLLDAGRSLEREEFSEERESETPGVFVREDVVPLSPEQLGLMLYQLPGGAELRRLTPAERQLVLEYFERLNGAPAREQALR